MNIQTIKLEKLQVNKDNPRTITKEKFDKLINSILVFPKMLEIRPIVIDGNFIALGGNQRTDALNEIAKLSIEQITNKLSSITDYTNMKKAEQKNLICFWSEWLKNKDVPIINAETLTEDEKKQFIIKDNNGFGEWNFAELSEKWDTSSLQDWGVDFPEGWGKEEEKKEKEETQTEKLSKIEYNGLYYEPKRIPKIKLSDCINTDKFEAKIKALDEYQLTDKQKETLKMFAYRFLKIDFEAVANYYAFNATEEEKKAIERLRLVLVDNGQNGYVEDDMLSILKSDLDYIEED